MAGRRADRAQPEGRRRALSQRKPESIDRALAVYGPEITWEAPARGLIYRDATAGSSRGRQLDGAWLPDEVQLVPKLVDQRAQVVDMPQKNLLGEYLRACRERVSPADVGLEWLGPRRVAGLRREEVALLAGISANYYLRLEQGRDRHPSAQVLESLGRALRLDETETAHLLALGQPRPRDTDITRLAAVPASIGQLLQGLGLPAFVQDEHFDVIASNAMARALSPTLLPGRNRLLSVFLDSDERALFTDWEEIAAGIVASFRASVAADADDPRTTELVNALSARDAHFRTFWERHDVANRVDRPPVRFTHPVVGALTLTRENLAIDGPDALRLMIYHAAQESKDAGRLAQLGGEPR